MANIPIAVAYGDGIGPEIMEAVLHILVSAKVPIEPHLVQISANGIDEKVWDTIRKTKVLLKGPYTTPQGGGFKSLNVTLRTTLGLFANVRPCVSYFPFVDSKHPEMDLVIIRENEEDLYCGIEYRQSPDVCHATKIISRQGSEKIIRYAFEYARKMGRKKVTCMTKDNILKMTDGLFHKVFDEIAGEYPDVLNEHWIVDIGAAKLADQPEIFDVVVLPNLYGDILSDVAAEIAGSVGLAGSANIGFGVAMFEALHGSAPRHAGKNTANPSGLLLAAIQMLEYLGLKTEAATIHNAWLSALENGLHTQDVYIEGKSKKKLGTKEFAAAVVEHLGQKPKLLPAAEPHDTVIPLKNAPTRTNPKRSLVGIDVVLYKRGVVQDFIAKISHINIGSLRLKSITNRGAEVWPLTHPETTVIDEWRCHFLAGTTVAQSEVIQILQAFDRVNMDVVAAEFVYSYGTD